MSAGTSSAREHLPPTSSQASTICLSAPGFPTIRSSGSSTANGSSPTMWRAHQTAWPRPSGCCWRTVTISPKPARDGSSDVEALALAAHRRFELEGDVEIIDQRRFAAPGDEDHLLDPGLARLVDRILDQRPVDDRDHFLGDRSWSPEAGGCRARRPGRPPCGRGCVIGSGSRVGRAGRHRRSGSGSAPAGARRRCAAGRRRQVERVGLARLGPLDQFVDAVGPGIGRRGQQFLGSRASCAPSAA